MVCIAGISDYQESYNYDNECYLSDGSDKSDFTNVDENSEEVLEEHWDVSSEDILRSFNEDDDGSQENGFDSKSKNDTLSFIMMFLVLWAAFYHISATALNHLIQFLHYVLTLFSSSYSLVSSFSNFLVQAEEIFPSFS